MIKYTNTDTQKREPLIQLLANGRLWFRDKTSYSPAYEANEWLHFDVYFEFTGATGTSKYSIYLNEKPVGNHAIYIDNMEIATTVAQE